MIKSLLLHFSFWRPFTFWVTVLLGVNVANADPKTTSPPAKGPFIILSSDEVIKVYWQDIVQAVNHHPKLAAAKFQIDGAKQGVKAIGAIPNPSLEATLGQGYARDGNASRFEWGLALNVPLGWISQRYYKVKSAEAEVDVTIAETKALRRDVLLELKTLFWNLLYDQSQVASLEDLKKQTKELTQSVGLRVEKGETRPIEKTRVEIEFEKVSNELEIARSAMATRQKQLALWFSLPKGKIILAGGTLDDLPDLMALEETLSKTFTTHPKILVSRARIRSLAAEVASEKMVRIPSITLSPFTSYELDRRSYGIGINLDFPLWNWNSGRIVQAQAKLSAEQKLKEATELDLKSTLIESFASCQSSVQTANRLKINVLPRSLETAATIEKIYKLGEANLLEVIDARRTLVEAKRLFLGALVQAQISCSRLSVMIQEEIP